MYESSVWEAGPRLEGGALDAKCWRWQGTEAWRERVPPRVRETGLGWGGHAWVRESRSCPCMCGVWSACTGIGTYCTYEHYTFHQVFLFSKCLEQQLKKSLLHKKLLNGTVRSLAILSGAYCSFVWCWSTTSDSTDVITELRETHTSSASTCTHTLLSLPHKQRAYHRLWVKFSYSCRFFLKHEQTHTHTQLTVFQCRLWGL